MRNSSIILLILMLLVISSCSIKGYKPIANYENNTISKLHIFDDDFTKALYKTSTNIYGNSITGLTLIKKTDSAIRVVSMSELGIKYFDFEFPINQMKPSKVHYIMESLNKKLFVKMLDSDFRLLLFSPVIDEKSNIMISDTDISKMLVKKDKFVYLFNSSGAITTIKKRNKLKPMISITGNEQSYPDSISIKHGKISFEYVIIK